MTIAVGENYAFPFRIDAATRRTAEVGYDMHVDHMIRQLLLTDPGERSDLPEFGCGLRAMVFAPITAALEASLPILVRQALNEWLAGIITLLDVSVTFDETTVTITISYLVVETQQEGSAVVMLP